METMLAVQMYTLRALTQTAEGIEQCFQKIEKMGWKAVQMSAWGPVEDQVVRDLADQYHLEICATHIPYDRILNHTDEVIAQHKTFGCQYVGLGIMPHEYLGSEEGIRTFCKNIAPAAKAIHDAGLTFIYHNHQFEFARFGNKTGMDILLENTDPEAFQFEMDTYWVTAGGGDPAEWIQKLKGRMDVVHFKDMVYVPEISASTYAPIGEGNLPWQRIIPACGEIGARWHIVEQDECRRDPFDCLASSLHYLQRMGLR